MASSRARFGIEVQLLSPTHERIVVARADDIMALYLAASPGQDLLVAEYSGALRSDDDVHHHVLLLSRNACELRQAPSLDFRIDYAYCARDTTGRLYTLGGEAARAVCRPSPTGAAASSGCTLKVFATGASLDAALAWLRHRFPWEFPRQQ